MKSKVKSIRLPCLGLLYQEEDTALGFYKNIKRFFWNENAQACGHPGASLVPPLPFTVTKPVRIESTRFGKGTRNWGSVLDGREKRDFPNYRNTLGGKVSISFQTLVQTCGLECPKLQELLLPCLCPSEPSSLLPVIITPLPSDHPLQNTEVLQPLLNQTPPSHLTGSCY